MAESALRLLGTFSLRLPGGTVRLGRKAQATLACVALAGDKGVSRGRLLGLLWPDLAEEDARNALRQCLHLLRHGLAERAADLDSEGDRLVLRKGSWDVDVLRFETLATRDDVPSLLEAATLYGGDFLEELDGGAEFERWALGQRERLRNSAHALLTRLSESSIDTAAREATVQLALRLLATDPVHEGCYRALMRVHERAGLRAKALQVGNECRKVLRTELGVEPSAQTAALMAELRGEGDPTSGTVPPAAPGMVTFRSGDDPAVMDLLLRGWQYFSLFTAEDNAKARTAYEAVIDLAPDHADAIAQLAWTHWLDAISGWTENAALSYEYAANCAASAVACNWNVPAAHTVQGKVFLWQKRFDPALEQMHRALALAPRAAYSHFCLADARSFCGMPEEALAGIQRAMDLDTNDRGVFLTIRGFALWMKREYHHARMALESASTRNPGYPWPYAILTAVHAERGDLVAARRTAAMTRQLNRRQSVDYAEQFLPFKNDDHRRRFVDAYRAAGMPAHEGPGGLPMTPPHRVALGAQGDRRDDAAPRSERCRAPVRARG